jgi:predicted nuclease of predicted toxin-antitoxin system
VKIKLDENLPDRLVAVLTGLGHNVDTVGAEQMTGRADPDVWSAAQAAQRFLITQDLDFSDVRRYTPGTHAGLLLVRLTRPGRNALLERVSTVFQTEKVEEWTGCLVVATEQKIRIRRPEPPRNADQGRIRGLRFHRLLLTDDFRGRR